MSVLSIRDSNIDDKTLAVDLAFLAQKNSPWMRQHRGAGCRRLPAGGWMTYGLAFFKYHNYY